MSRKGETENRGVGLKGVLAADFMGFSLPLKLIPDRDSEHSAPLGLPSPPVLQPSLGVSCRTALAMPWDGAAADPPRVCRAG